MFKEINRNNNCNVFGILILHVFIAGFSLFCHNNIVIVHIKKLMFEKNVILCQYFIATPLLDYIPISEVLTFTNGQYQGHSLCVHVTIIEDVFVEAKETFEVILLPTPEDLFKVLLVPGMNRAVVIISDGVMGKSMYDIFSENLCIYFFYKTKFILYTKSVLRYSEIFKVRFMSVCNYNNSW